MGPQVIEMADAAVDTALAVNYINNWQLQHRIDYSRYNEVEENAANLLFIGGFFHIPLKKDWHVSERKNMTIP